jgi:hypothetical protein
VSQTRHWNRFFWVGAPNVAIRNKIQYKEDQVQAESFVCEKDNWNIPAAIDLKLQDLRFGQDSEIEAKHSKFSVDESGINAHDEEAEISLEKDWELKKIFQVISLPILEWENSTTNMSTKDTIFTSIVWDLLPKNNANISKPLSKTEWPSLTIIPKSKYTSSPKKPPGPNKIPTTSLEKG